MSTDVLVGAADITLQGGAAARLTSGEAYEPQSR